MFFVSSYVTNKIFLVTSQLSAVNPNTAFDDGDVSFIVRYDDVTVHEIMLNFQDV